MPMHMCVSLWDGRESVSSRHFYVAVPQPISFCVLKELANCNTMFISPALKTSLPGQRQFPFFSPFAAELIMPKRKADKNWPSASRRFRHSCNRHSERNLWIDTHQFTRVGCNVCCTDFSISHVSMCDIVMYIVLTYQNMCIMLKIQLLHLKQITLHLSLLKGWQLWMLIYELLTLR